jgi:two-component sensor histidine kinase
VIGAGTDPATVDILMLEDSDLDAELIQASLERARIPARFVRTVSREQFVEALGSKAFDLILSDFALPNFDGLSALRLAREMTPDVPFIIVSGVMGEEIAIESMQQGATDYVLKSRLARLPGAVERALEVARERARRQRVELRTRMLVAELSHRVKNTLMTVISIATQTLRRSADLAEFETAFMGRMHALAGAHSLLLRANWGDMDLTELLQEVVRPFRRGDLNPVEFDGEPIHLPPQHALTVNLIMHELATNAAKYGALSAETGRVDLAWRVHESADGDRRLVLRWRERGGPAVTPPTRRGFGTTLIERSVGFELGGSIDLSFTPSGVTCEIMFPLEPPGPVGAESDPLQVATA